MPAYMISDSTVHDQALMDAYAQKARPTVIAHGGKVHAAGTSIEHKEGAWKPKRLVIIEFPSMAAAKVSLRGASPLSSRQPRLNKGSPEVSM